MATRPPSLWRPQSQGQQRGGRGTPYGGTLAPFFSGALPTSCHVVVLVLERWCVAKLSHSSRPAVVPGFGSVRVTRRDGWGGQGDVRQKDGQASRYAVQCIPVSFLAECTNVEATMQGVQGAQGRYHKQARGNVGRRTSARV